MSDQKKIPYYVTERGLLARMKLSRPDHHRINGQPLTKTFHPEWWIVEGETELSTYTVWAGTKAINERYVLINQAVEGIAPVLKREEVVRDDEGDWAGPYKGLDSLYKYECDQLDLGFKQQEFESEPLGNLTFAHLGDPTEFRYKLSGERYDKDGPVLDYKSLLSEYGWLPTIQVDDIAKAMTPDVAWHLYPCSVDSHTTYRIIRAYVRDHIDPMVAEVTSDYDFCFTVKKKVRVVPYIKKWEIRKDNLKSYRPPRFKTKSVDYELLEIFEMTHAKERYRGYTVVDGFRGESLAELAANIDRYMKELMEVVNAPLAQCPHCHGLGVTDYHKLPTNERIKLGIAA
jgi:hypothetical protein